jgi:hypothetical protein
LRIVDSTFVAPTPGPQSYRPGVSDHLLPSPAAKYMKILLGPFKITHAIQQQDNIMPLPCSPLP